MREAEPLRHLDFSSALRAGLSGWPSGFSSRTAELVPDSPGSPYPGEVLRELSRFLLPPTVATSSAYDELCSSLVSLVGTHSGFIHFVYCACQIHNGLGAHSRDFQRKLPGK